MFEYLQRRLSDPVTWLALLVIGAWAVSAVWGFAPFQMLAAICFVFAAGEWWSLFSWWNSKRRSSARIVQQFTPAIGRWKVAVLVLIGAVTFLLDLWVWSSLLTPLGVGLSVFGLSSLITLWHTWSRPIIAVDDGLLVGVNIVKWGEIRRITWSDTGHVRIDFVSPNYFFGASLRVEATPAQRAELQALVPAAVKRASTFA